MKKLLIYFVPIIGLGLILFYSCHKEEFENKQNIAQNQLTQKDYEMSEEDELFNTKLLKFKSEIDTINEDSLYTSHWNLSKDSTVWYIRAYINAVYCKSTLNYTEVISDSIYVDLGINYSSLLNFNDVHSAFVNIKSAIATRYSALEYEQKELYFIYFNEIIADQNQAYAIVLAVFGIDPGSGGEPSLWQPFDEGDEWWFGKKLGHCDWTGVGADAAERIEYFLNTHVPGSYYVPPAPQGYHYIYIPDPLPIFLYGDEYPNPNDPTPDDNEEDYLIYYCSEDNGIITFDNKCLDGQELNFYYFSEREIICELLPDDLNKEPNWVFRSCDLQGQELDGGSITRHLNKLYYATRRLVMNSLPGYVQINE